MSKNKTTYESILQNRLNTYLDQIRKENEKKYGIHHVNKDYISNTDSLLDDLEPRVSYVSNEPTFIVNDPVLKNKKEIEEQIAKNKQQEIKDFYNSFLNSPEMQGLRQTIDDLTNANKLQQDQIYDLLEQLKPKPVPSAAEIRAILGDTSSVQSITDDYNKATNEFYDNMKAGQQKNWNQATRSNLLYTDNVANQYLNSYANTAPTQANKAMVGANNLMSQLGNNNINAQAENAMLDQINMLDESRKAELANNPYYAEKRWNDKNAYYGQLGANYNKEDVRQYVAKQNALTEKAIAGSALQGQLAHANATKYSGLMNYRGSQAGAAASAYNGINNSLSGLYNLYTRLRGTPAGGSMLDEILDNSQGAK